MKKKSFSILLGDILTDACPANQISVFCLVNDRPLSQVESSSNWKNENVIASC